MFSSNCLFYFHLKSFIFLNLFCYFLYFFFIFLSQRKIKQNIIVTHEFVFFHSKLPTFRFSWQTIANFLLPCNFHNFRKTLWKNNFTKDYSTICDKTKQDAPPSTKNTEKPSRKHTTAKKRGKNKSIYLDFKPRKNGQFWLRRTYYMEPNLTHTHTNTHIYNLLLGFIWSSQGRSLNIFPDIITLKEKLR